MIKKIIFLARNIISYKDEQKESAQTMLEGSEFPFSQPWGSRIFQSWKIIWLWRSCSWMPTKPSAIFLITRQNASSMASVQSFWL